MHISNDGLERQIKALKPKTRTGAQPREILLQALGSSGVLAQTAESLVAEQTYTVVFREAAKGSLHKLQNGLIEAAVRDGKGQYIQKAFLKPSGLNLLGSISTIALQIAMTNLANRMEKLQVTMDAVRDHQLAQQKGAILAAVKQIKQIDKSASEAIKVITLVQLRTALRAQFEALCCTIGTKVAALPDPGAISFWNWSTSAPEITRKALDIIQGEVTLAICCLCGLEKAEERLNGSVATAALLVEAIGELQSVTAFPRVRDKAR